MTLFVDTSVWSLALRRDAPAEVAEVAALVRAIERGDALLAPDRDDYVAAADLRNACRRSSLRIGTIDALLAQLCIRHQLTLLSTDRDFVAVATRFPLKLWQPITSAP